LKAAVVGARRVRQGTGEYVARELARRGVDVVAIVGTRPESLAEARANLHERHGIEARGYTSLEDLLGAEEVDLVAICSPIGAHEAQVRAALARGCHVFCEKPLLWRAGSEDDPQGAARNAGVVAALCAESHAAGRLLSLNTQWPFTLSAFDQLHPGVRTKPLERFEMHLGPTRLGAAAMLDSGSHPLSMLWALAGPGRLSQLEVEDAGASGSDDSMTVRCGYEHRAGTAAVCLSLKRCPSPPRPAGYAVNGAAVERRIELPEYRISLVHGDETALVGDPLADAVEDFLTRARAGEPTRTDELVAHATQLHQLVRAAQQATSSHAGALAGEETS